VFWPFVKSNLSFVKGKCIELADMYGDPDVDAYLAIEAGNQ
jgi:hypothetical protein